MDPITVAALIGAGGAIGTAGLQGSVQKKINQQNILENQSRFAAETELANTAHQREVVDLRLAGLNPILSAGGSGASVPTQSAYEGKAPDLSALATLGDAVNNARSVGSAVDLNNAKIDSMQGDITASRMRDAYLRTPEGRRALEDKILKESAPDNPVQAAWMTAQKGRSLTDGVVNTANAEYSPLGRQAKAEQLYEDARRALLQSGGYEATLSPRWDEFRRMSFEEQEHAIDLIKHGMSLSDAMDVVFRSKRGFGEGEGNFEHSLKQNKVKWRFDK